MRKALASLLALCLSGAPSPLWAAAWSRPTLTTLPTSSVRVFALPRNKAFGLSESRSQPPWAPLVVGAPRTASPYALAETARFTLASLPQEGLGSLSANDAWTVGSRLLGESGRGPTPDVAGSWSAGRRLAPQGDSRSTSERRPLPPSPRRPFLLRNSWLVRLLLAPAVRSLYRLDVRDLENLPDGPAILVPNHVSWIDPILLSFAARRPLRFLMERSIYETRGLRWLFRALGAIPIASRDRQELRDRSLAEAEAAIAAGETVVLFPEGQLTYNGSLTRFRRGFERLAEATGAPVIPAHLDGLWGSVFSRRQGLSFGDRLRAGRLGIIARFGKPLVNAEPQTTREAVEALAAESMAERVQDKAKTLPLEFLGTAKRLWSHKAVADSTGQDLTFGKALTAAVLLAGLLKARLPEAKNVGLLLPPSAGGVLANIALGMLGKVPVNINYTASREALNHAVKTAGLGATITSKRFLAVLKEKGAAAPPENLLFLEDLLPLIPKWKKTLTYLALRILPRPVAAALWFRRAPRALDETATVLFTSGSSALPKGVELTHANIRSNIEMVREVFPRSPADVVLGVLPFFHSFGYTVSLWFPLTAGLGAAYHPNPLDADAIGVLAAKHKPTILLGTPTFLMRYVQRVPAESFASLKLVVAGAEKLRGTIADAFEAKFGVRPYEGYGATELSPVAAVALPDVGPQKGSKEASVGKPLPGTAMRVVDPETFAPLPYGTQGLLLVKGAHVMKGYLGEPKKTAEVLKDGWYATGDLAVIDRDGFVTLAGRLSRFSKLAGEMVSHVAVEEKLQQASGLPEQAFVVASAPDEKRGERLIVLYAGWEGDIDRLLAKAKEAGLPPFWTPAASDFHRIEKIPLLGTGKLDLKAIKELALSLSRGS